MAVQDAKARGVFQAPLRGPLSSDMLASIGEIGRAALPEGPYREMVLSLVAEVQRLQAGGAAAPPLPEEEGTPDRFMAAAAVLLNDLEDPGAGPIEPGTVAWRRRQRVAGALCEYAKHPAAFRREAPPVKGGA
jgi:hypothetical protein